MKINMENYKKEDIKDQKDLGFVDGMEEAAEELDCAKEAYLENIEVPSETFYKICCEIVEDFAAFAKEYINDYRDNAIVACIDEEASDV